MTLSAQDVSLDRGGKLVIDQVSTTLEPGQITAIVGPNGAGKTSLLMALAGLLDLAAGEVQLDSAPLQQIIPRDRAKRIGYLPQSADVAWDVSVATLVALGRFPHRDEAAEPIEAALKIMALEALRDRPASQLSGGEKARTLLARVLAGEPDWILADEPLAALDLAHQHNLITHLKSCAGSGQGVVIVLHDLALAMNHADRVLVLDNGQLVSDGQPEQALTSDVISKVWGVQGRWLGEPGQHALVAQNPD